MLSNAKTEVDCTLLISSEKVFQYMHGAMEVLVQCIDYKNL